MTAAPRAVIVGIGIDVCDERRFGETLDRTPALRSRLFTPAESMLPLRSLAARFAAKEALAKALGAPRGLHWTDAEIVKDEHGAPHLQVAGSVADRAAVLGVDRLHVSMSHDAGLATAIVIAESHRP